MKISNCSNMKLVQHFPRLKIHESAEKQKNEGKNFSFSRLNHLIHSPRLFEHALYDNNNLFVKRGIQDNTQQTRERDETVKTFWGSLLVVDVVHSHFPHSQHTHRCALVRMICETSKIGSTKSRRKKLHQQLIPYSHITVFSLSA